MKRAQFVGAGAILMTSLWLRTTLHAEGVGTILYEFPDGRALHHPCCAFGVHNTKGDFGPRLNLKVYFVTFVAAYVVTSVTLVSVVFVAAALPCCLTLSAMCSEEIWQ